MTNAVIVGSGVIGLSIAYQLLECAELRPEKLTIIAAHFPQDEPISHEFTSPWAGAHFRPFPHRPETYESDERESKYTRVTYNIFKRLAAEHPESTIQFMKGVDLLEDPPVEYKTLGPGYNSDSLEKFRKLDVAELPRNVAFGCEYRTYCLNAPVYLAFLQEKVRSLCLAHGTKLLQKRMTLNSLKQVYTMFPDCTALFNASGQGLQMDGGFDTACFSIRGQTLLLDVPHTTKYDRMTITHQDRLGNWTFVIKRPTADGSAAQYILGGTKQPDDFSVMPRDWDSDALMARGRVLFPELMCDGKFRVARVNVGFRPARRGGSRVEVERSPYGPVIHAYGLGGMGYETSLGVATHALKLYSSTCPAPKL